MVISSSINCIHFPLINGLAMLNPLDVRLLVNSRCRWDGLWMLNMHTFPETFHQDVGHTFSRKPSRMFPETFPVTFHRDAGQTSPVTFRGSMGPLSKRKLVSSLCLRFLVIYQGFKMCCLSSEWSKRCSADLRLCATVVQLHVDFQSLKIL